MLIDSHAHLFFEDYKDEVPQVLARAQEAGVGGLINIGTGIEESRRAIELAEKHPWIFASAGIHPHDAAQVTEEDLKEICRLAAHDRVVAIGEVGLDYHYEHSPKEVQQKRFRDLVHLAQKCRKPLIIHCREAFEDCFRILDEEKGWEVGGVFHCYTGNLATAQRIITKGFHVSFSGIVTFKKSEPLQEAARKLPIDRILIETDAPFLSPAPHRGKRNEPAYVALVAGKIAELRGVPPEEIAKVTAQNTCRLFGLSLG